MCKLINYLISMRKRKKVKAKEVEAKVEKVVAKEVEAKVEKVVAKPKKRINTLTGQRLK